MRDLTEQEAKELDEQFTYHAPTGAAQIAAYGHIRNAGRDLAEMILRNAPSSADRTASIRKVREAVMTANAAVALAPQAYEPGGECNR